MIIGGWKKIHGQFITEAMVIPKREMPVRVDKTTGHKIVDGGLSVQTDGEAAKDWMGHGGAIAEGSGAILSQGTTWKQMR